MKKMAEQEEAKKEKKKVKLNQKYAFTMSEADTMEPMIDFKVNLMKLSIITIVVILILMVLTALVITMTPIREYLPGYADRAPLDREVYELNRRVDSLQRDLERKDVYFNNLKMVIEGYPFENDRLESIDIYAPLIGFNLDTLEIRRSAQETALIEEFEEENLYSLYPAATSSTALIPSRNSNFFAPLVGTVAKAYNSVEGHFGIDIVSTDNQVIKATQDGTVVIASWTIDYGYTIAIQHASNYLSTYKHNATLLKKEGDFVKAGEAIAILGASGELSEGPMLHFELWHNGLPVDPMEYMQIEN